MTTSLASETPVPISSSDLDTMLRFSRTVFRLKDNPAYLVALEDELPATARIATAWPSVLMGFDFHLTASGPKLIEINNNAGGLYIGDGRWLPQPANAHLPGLLPERLVAMFPQQWMNIAIMDEDVTAQYMYPEMCAYADLLRADGRHACVVSPQDLQPTGGRLTYKDECVDAIYNRHTDFYLEERELAHVRAAYEAGQVVINPHPRSYALIGDKRRMVDWWQPGLLESCVDMNQCDLIRAVTPETHRMADMDHQAMWRDRKQWVFKPAARHGGKGVILGKAMSRKRLESMDVDETIVQQLVPASEVEVEGRQLKLDIRLYMHGESLIALAGRAWSGQVTNFREPGSGWVSLSIDA
ncbi:hypothetical protein [Mariprofundus ferrooxydans]|uniref:Glutathionylspermidine synthase pre-ATP-grasp-like domain-containing protein n=1 Tax=Mariprofundus ferrooxydans PV-1 TaxID=314345 RepID=Q0F3R8_9PROT|nr:hypothetical protein [Mariprofundus ferrooxydans]EAU55873.1 hypothetical protein SPV1_03613 [Mariprofundus ferrooxydans PV-1]KON48154.1 hypothetical protein AL013_03730 [Mariprofundus ferrooxydans]